MERLMRRLNGSLSRSVRRSTQDIFQQSPLDLRFALQKTLDPRITFTRASSGTYVDSQGVIKTATTNLLTFSEQFDSAAWNKYGTSVTANAVTSPTGSSNASKLVEDTSAGGHGIYRSATVTTGLSYVWSGYFKAAERSIVQLKCQATGNVYLVEINLSTQTATTRSGSGTTTITDVGNGWYRVVSIATSTASGTGYWEAILCSAANTASYTGNGTSGIYIWGAQLEQSSTVGEYIPTTSTINSAPRFDHSITSSVTNLLLRSEEFDNASWAKAQGSITANAVVAPNGLITADAFIENTATAQHAVLFGVTVSANTTYTASCYLKSAGRSTGWLQFNNASYANGVRAIFDLSAGTASALNFGSGSGATASILPAGDGWFRVSISGIIDSSSTTGVFAVYLNNGLSYTGDGTSGLYLWGAQLEQSSTVGTYVPTTTAPATRATTDSLGLLVEEQRTNSVTNNTMVGAVAGTPGTLPTGWGTFVSPTGLTRTIVGSGTVNGINYIDVRFNGTPSSTGEITLSLSPATTATLAQAWTSTVWLSLAGGSLSNIGGISLRNFERNSGAYVREVSTNFVSSISSDLVRRQLITTSFGAGANEILLTLSLFATAGGTPIDITLRIGMPQLEQGAFPTSVIPTTTAAVTRSADVASITGSNFGVSRTNLSARSEELDDTVAWAVSNAAIPTANAAVAPNGTSTADKLIASNGLSGAVLFQATTLLASTTYTFSIYAKAAEWGWVALQLRGPENVSSGAWFDLTNGSVGTIDAGVSATIQAAGNGWYRCVVTKTAGIGAGTGRQRIYTTNANGVFSTGDGTSGIYLWGSQLETSSTATAYIPTTNAAVTVVDSPWYRQDEGTVFVDGAAQKTDNAIGGFVVINDLTGNNRVDIRQYRFDPIIVGSGSASITWSADVIGSINPNIFYRQSVAYSANSHGSAIAGALRTSTSAIGSIAATRLALFMRDGQTTPTGGTGGTIRRLTYWPQRLPNPTLQQITQ